MSGYVLIVDDDRDTRDILNNVVSSLGVETQLAQDGIEALERIGQEKPDLILLDIMMPRMDGFSVLMHLNGDPSTRRIPVIVVSALVGEQLELLPGVVDVMEKAKFRVADLRDVVATTLYDRQSVRQQQKQIVG